MQTKYWVKNILLAEDDEEDVEIFREILQGVSSGLQLQVAANGTQLMKMLQLMPVIPDLLFLDLNMPVKNGFQCLKEIREREEWNQLEVIVLSTASHPEQVEKAKELGASAYLVKSTDYRVFKESLINCVQTKAQDRQAFLISV